jgi:hypothetical protein
VACERRHGATASMPDNGQAKRMKQTIKEAAAKIYHYDDLESPRPTT